MCILISTAAVVMPSSETVAGSKAGVTNVVTPELEKGGLKLIVQSPTLFHTTMNSLNVMR
jgi:hypothetical protein